MNIYKLVGQPLGPYHLEAILGRGGMAVVYRARHTDGQTVALKVLFPPPEAEHELLTRFQREAETISRLNHPNIVSMLGVGEAEGYIFMAMPLIEGDTLAVRLSDLGRLDEPTAIDIVWQIADALYYAHSQGIIHRDIKPSNILLTPDGQAMLMDFGIALALDAPTLTRTGYTVGTPAYMSPEQANSQRTLDGRSDLYSLGVVLYQMITGQLPFQGQTPQMLHAHVYLSPPPPSTIVTISPALEQLILKALAKEPDQRYQTGAAFAQALAQLEAPTSSQLETVTRALPPEKNRGWSKLGLALIGLLLLSAIIPLTMLWSARPSPTPVAIATPRPTFTPTPLPTDTPTAIATNTPIPLSTDTPLPSPTTTLIPSTVLPYPTGALLQSSGEGVFRLNDQGELQHVYDWPTFLAFDFRREDIQTVDDAFIKGRFHGAELTRLIQAEEGRLDWVVAGARWRINRWQADLAAHGYQGLPASQSDATLLKALPLSLMVADLPSGTLVKEGENYYRLFADGTLRRFTTVDLVTAYGYNLEQATDLPEAVRYLYGSGATLTKLLQSEPGGALFLITNGQRVPMPSGDALWAMGYGVEDISQVPQEFLTSFALASTVTLTETTPITDCPITIDATLRSITATSQLGCPRSAAITTPAAWEGFEHGLLLWRADLNLIYVVNEKEAAYATGDRWLQGIDVDFDGTIVPPSGFYQPVRGFGKIWRERADVKSALGWATTEENNFTAIIQEFEQGLVWQDTTEAFYVILLNQGGYLRSKE